MKRVASNWEAFPKALHPHINKVGKPRHIPTKKVFFSSKRTFKTNPNSVQKILKVLRLALKGICHYRMFFLVRKNFSQRRKQNLYPNGAPLSCGMGYVSPEKARQPNQLFGPSTFRGTRSRICINGTKIRGRVPASEVLCTGQSNQWKKHGHT